MSHQDFQGVVMTFTIITVGFFTGFSVVEVVFGGSWRALLLSVALMLTVVLLARWVPPLGSAATHGQVETVNTFLDMAIVGCFLAMCLA